MRIFKSRVAIYAIISVFMGGVAWATTPAADYKTVTSKAYVDSLISDSDISSHTVNGATLSNEASYFYGTSTTAANQAIKDVTVTGITTPGANDHPIIVVQPEHTSMLALISGTPEFKLRLNSDAAADAKPIYVNGAPLDIKSQDSVWNENYPSAFVFDGTNWVFLGAGYNIDTVISSYKVNGAPLKKTGTFYGTSSTVATTGAKTVTISGFPTTYTPVAGQIIVIKPTITSTYDGAHTLSVNSSTAVPIYYNGAAVTDAATAAMVWTANVPATFVYESTGSGRWVFAGHGVDSTIPAGTSGNVVTYSGTAGAPGSRGVLNDLNLDESKAVTAYSVTFDGTTNNWPTDDATKLVSGTGLADALRLKQNKILAGTADDVVTYSGTPGATNSRGVLNDLNTVEEKALNMYSTTFDGTEYNWPAADATKLVSGTGFADALSHKQNKIPLTSNGTGSTPNYVYDATTNPTADGSVITTTGTAGTVSQRGIATAAVSDGNGGYTNGDWIPTVGAVMNAISPLAWTSAEDDAATGYGTTFDLTSTHTTGNWSYQTEDKLIDTTALASALRLKQNKIPAGTADDVVTYSGTAGTTNSRGVINSLGTEEITALSGYSATLDGTTGNWPTADATKLVSGTGLADALSRKQHKIAAMASVYDSANTPTANGALITATSTAGGVGQRGIATAPVYVTENNVTTLDNANWIPTMGALMNAVSGATSGTINGASVGSASAYFYDNAGGGAASSCAKTASIPSIDTLAAGQVIVVTPATTSTCSGAHTLALNGGDAAPIYYDGAAIPHAGIAAYVWAAGRPSTFVYDGTKWLFIGDPMMSVSDGRAATNTTPRVVGPMALKAIVHGLTLSTVSGSGITALSLNTNQSSAITTSDTIIGAFGKLQGQINSLGSDLSSISGLTGSTINGIDLKEFVRNGGGDAVFYDGECSYDGKNMCTFNIPYLDAESPIKNGMLIVLRPKGDIKSEEIALETYGLLLSTVVADKSYIFPVLYNGDTVNDVATASIVLSPDYPSIFVFDESAEGGAWLFAGSGIDLATHTVNGAPLSNLESYYYGSGTASANYMAVTIQSIPSVEKTLPKAGQIIAVQPTNGLFDYNCITSNWELKLNDFNSATVLYAGDPLDCDPSQEKDEKNTVWSHKYPSMFVFDGTYWVFLGHGYDKNTGYDALTSDASGNLSGPAGTGTAPGVISPQTLKNSIHRVTLAANSGTTAWTATNSRMTTSDTMLGALGKAQGQIDNRQYVIPQTGKYTTHSGTSWTTSNVSDYDAAAVKGTSLPTKTGTAGGIGERMIVDSGTDTTGWATAKLANAIPSMSKISAITASMQSQKVCYEYKPGTGANPTDADCWLWRLP